MGGSPMLVVGAPTGASEPPTSVQPTQVATPPQQGARFCTGCGRPLASRGRVLHQLRRPRAGCLSLAELLEVRYPIRPWTELLHGVRSPVGLNAFLTGTPEQDANC